MLRDNCSVTDMAGGAVRVLTASDERILERRLTMELADGWRLVGPVAAGSVGDNLWLVATLYRELDQDRDETPPMGVRLTGHHGTHPVSAIADEVDRG